MLPTILIPTIFFASCKDKTNRNRRLAHDPCYSDVLNTLVATRDTDNHIDLV